MRYRILAAAGLLLAGAAQAYADDATGVWARDTGESRVRIAPCGGALCGTITWLKSADSPAKVGQRVFFDMKPAGANAWEGKAFNPEDGKTYTGKMTLAGDKLTTRGCALAGLICKSVTWSRVN
ncbi:DUF2147 domain-containing protein [Terrarubrum flagellatum]|uniref:DUF2147 domain-containing protein n=1 Tax=Terrirubrum flagellatum TaxID=2895980 RepID=UPI0031452BCB